MASPYVAGAAVLIRQAMAFAGRTNITQDSIYQVMARHGRLGLRPRHRAKLPQAQHAAGARLRDARRRLWLDCRHGASPGHRRRQQHRSPARSSRISDHDYFTFTAAATGHGHLHGIDQLRAGDALGGRRRGRRGHYEHDTSSLSLEVVAGQSYTIGVCTTAGVGFYSVRCGDGARRDRPGHESISTR